ncbi:MgtC/SapB family protein [Isosphaeraceae bacterium EP7]
MGLWWSQIEAAIREDFADIPDLKNVVKLILRLLMAATLGGLLGYQRERVGKPAGLKTHMLVATGAALFILIPQQAGATTSDLSRVIQGMIAGIGFLGAGAILKQDETGEIKGLTTAAGIWLTAAIGMAAGMGRETSATLGTILALLILTLLRRIEKFMR